MACCVSGHDQATPAIEQVNIDAPPCHEHSQGAHVDVSQADHSSELPFDCAGGDDCDAALMSAETFQFSSVTPQVSSEIPFIILTAHFPGYDHKPIVYKTGPPNYRRATAATPITLKQRLLI